MKKWIETNNPEYEQEKIILRDPKMKYITFEMTSINKFAISLNFFMPEELVSILRKYGAAYKYETREWYANLNNYKEIAMEIS